MKRRNVRKCTISSYSTIGKIKEKMSGHNPHGHLSQPPNSSWNPLQFQVPSYIPRQPQLAHMSNERQLPRSPLTWHTPTPPEALYSFISANHKNLELNPLLPSFVRGPPPFGSMDLTIQSARNSTTPSPRSLTSPPPEFPHNKQMPRSLTPNSLTNTNMAPNPSVIQSTASIREKFQNSNGNNGDMMSAGNIFIRDARQINNELVKMAARDAMELVPPPTGQPVELVKDVPYQATKTHIVPTSPQRMSPPRPPSVPSNNIPDTPQSPSPGSPTPDTPIPSEILPKDVTSNSGIANILPQFAVTPVNSSHENTLLSGSVPSPPSNSVSNEDSVDSNSSRTRRKRKPNKTVPSSGDTDEDSQPSPEKNSILEVPNNNIFKSASTETNVVARQDSTEDEPAESTKDCEKQSDSEVANQELPEGSVPDDTSGESNKSSESSSPSAPSVVPDNSETTAGLESVAEKEVQEAVVNNVDNEEKPQSPERCSQPESPDEEKEIKELSEESNKKESSPEDEPENYFDSPRKRTKRKGDSDDIETIDKIAAMIAGTEVEPIESVENSESDAQNDKSEPQSSSSKINDLKEILETSFCNETQPQEENITEAVKENCFEEVENKLEEMFAGIEDERPPPCLTTSAIEPVDAQACNEVVSELSLGNQLDDKVDDILFDEQKPSTSSTLTQKRTHSTKHDQMPPKKKRKIVKKPVPAQKPSSKTKTKNGNKTSKLEKPTKEKVKDETSQESKYKGPFLLIKDDGSVNVVNTPLTEDDIEKQNKVKKSIHNHNKSDRNKIRGLHVSTLSMKYDADTTDATWMCVFCKRGPHKLGLGDLFGPYFVTTNCEEFEFSQQNVIDDEFVSKRTKAEMYQKHPNGMPVMPSSSSSLSTIVTPSNVKKKRKTSDSPCTVKSMQSNTDTKDIFTGMTKASETSYEIWLHEDCAVWASGVHVVGATIVGLEAAVWSSTKHKCSYCSDNGATLCCLQRGCSQKAHISCARIQNWTLDERKFKSLCEAHSASTS